MLFIQQKIDKKNHSPIYNINTTTYIYYLTDRLTVPEKSAPFSLLLVFPAFSIPCGLGVRHLKEIPAHV